MKQAFALAGLTLLAVAGAGCGSGGNPSCPGDGSTARVQRETPRGTRYLTDVRVTRTACADRVEFVFERGTPGYRIEYVDARRARTEDGSGRHIPVAGRAFLLVRLADAATARTDGSTLTRTYGGPRHVPGGDAAHVREAVKTGDFEAVVTWAIGLDRERGFTVTTAKDRIAVDVG